MTAARRFPLVVSLGLYCGLFLLAATIGSMGYFHFGRPQDTCASCHEMGSVHANWSASAHSTLHCRNCHGGSLTLDAHALRSHVNRVVQHFTGDPGRPIHLAESDVLRLHASCEECHPQTFADWKASKHSATYARIFLDTPHNQAELPASDCLRCHGMFFAGEIKDLITPVSKTGPWAMKDASKSDQPTIPCLTCHRIHIPAGRAQTIHFYDQRERTHLPADLLPVAEVFQGERAVKVSRDPRQRLCQQCHAPSAAQGHQLGSSDDRTPVGVHEGLSCRDCHRKHTASAKASCQACHPTDSHCGIDVEKMDTTFLSTESKHNIHTVACQDCHPQGRPVKVRVAKPTKE